MKKGKKEKKPSLLRKIIRWAITAVVAVLLLAAFYLAVILGHPQENENAVQADMTQPLLNASPAVTVTEEARLNEINASFPVPVMQAMSGSGLQLISGVSSDLAYEGGFARKTVLTYQTQTGRQMLVESIYPARALELLGKGDYHMGSVAGQALAGMESVRMENGKSIRLHARSETGLYAVTVPMMDSSELAETIRSLQLIGNE
ncbi:MAG: hypothetical protein IJ507_10110 [Clostridia bacterium]|nr:hypothetical protein [Clostridia bacterium]